MIYHCSIFVTLNVDSRVLPYVSTISNIKFIGRAKKWAQGCENFQAS